MGCITESSDGSIYVEYFLTFILCSDHWRTSSQKCFCDRSSSYVLHAHGTLSCWWQILIYSICPPATDLMQHKGTCIYLTSSCGGQMARDVSFRAVISCYLQVFWLNSAAFNERQAHAIYVLAGRLSNEVRNKSSLQEINNLQLPFDVWGRYCIYVLLSSVIVTL